MKKYTTAVLLFLMMLSLVILPAVNAQTTEVTAEPPLFFNAQAERPIYQNADKDSDVIRQLASGEAFALLSMDEQWAEIVIFNEAGEELSGFTNSVGLHPLTPEDGIRRVTVSSPDTNTRLPLRAAPRKSSKSLGKYYNGVTALVLEELKNNWIKVRIGDLAGYFPMESLTINAPAGSVVSTIPIVSVNNPDDPGLNLRSAQSFKSDTKATYSNGRNVQVLGVTEDFVHVLTEDGLTGFMMAWGVSPQPSYADIDISAVNVPRPEGSLTVIDNPGGQGANLRKKASTASDSLGLYLNGTEVVVTGGGEYWKKVWVEGKTGWMMAQMLKGMVPEEFGN